MSKQSEAKSAQRYSPKPVLPTCGNCAHFKSDKSQREGMFGGIYVDETNLRCGIGCFAVKKMGSCSMFTLPTEAE
jgi:hypothetical protein